MNPWHHRALVALALLQVVARLVPNTHAAEPASIGPEFRAALRSGDARRVQAILDRGAGVGVHIDARDPHGDTPLMLAALHGGTATMRLLLRRGADVQATNHGGATALMRAAVDPTRVRLLLDHGARVNVRSALGNTPLLLAARSARSHRTVALLLEHGADVRATNQFGATALMAATAGGDIETVRLLLRHGADPNAQPTLDQTGFLFGGGRTPLMWAAFRGRVDILKVLIDAGADINQPGLIGTALAQATWADRKEAVALLAARGAKPDIAGFMDGFTPLHWAASSGTPDPGIVRRLLAQGADPNLGGGEPVDAFLGTPQTPLMLARRQGNAAILEVLAAAGATNQTPDRARTLEYRPRAASDRIDPTLLRAVIGEAVAPLQVTSLASKKSFISHGSRQDCTSCHQQHLPLAAIGLARKFDAPVNAAEEQALIRIVQEGEIKNPEIDGQPLFHPDPVMTKGYELLAYAAEDLPADDNSDFWVHHLAAIQGPQGQWHNNLPRPPIQTGDIAATALAVHALKTYPLPGRSLEMSRRIDRARCWLWKAKAEDTDSRIYQLLGLAWCGEGARALQPLAEALLGEQRDDGGWGQLAGLPTDAYATGQALYALRIASGLGQSDPRVERGIRFLLNTQLADGTWYVRRRAFPFQPTMDSGFPHGRDSWISAAATSWAVMALSLPDEPQGLARAARPRTASAP